uniref:N-acetyltransferase 16, like n=1 Tax=Astyanax mexicanus TaxID=7994 RepID=A0A8B9KVD7_ASTMX
MAISHGIYAGNDYLPHRYHIWMTEKDRVTIIARRDGKLVRQAEICKTVVVEGLRVCPSERGRGVAGLIQRITDAMWLIMCPFYCSFFILSFQHTLLQYLLVSVFQAVLSLIGEAKSFNSFVLDLKAKLDSIEKTEQSTTTNSQLTVLKDDQQLNALLLDPDLSTRLQLPGGAIIQDWLPLKPVESNLEILKSTNLTWLADTSNDKPRFVSFYTPPYPIPFNGGSLRLNIDMYGEDLPLARKALITHLKQVTGEIHGTVLVHIYMNQTLWTGMQRFCEGDEGVKQFQDYWEQLFLERELS